MPMNMELIEGSETSAISFVTPGNYPKENITYGTRRKLKISCHTFPAETSKFWQFSQPTLLRNSQKLHF